MKQLPKDGLNDYTPTPKISLNDRLSSIHGKRLDGKLLKDDDEDNINKK